MALDLGFLEHCGKVGSTLSTCAGELTSLAVSALEKDLMTNERRDKHRRLGVRSDEWARSVRQEANVQVGIQWRRMRGGRQSISKSRESIAVLSTLTRACFV